MRIRRFVAKTYMLFSHWTFVHEPLEDKTLVIGAPHTSNWDGVFMALCFWSLGRPFNFLVKESVTRVPLLGPFVRAIGGMPIDRSAAHGVVGQVVARAAEADEFTVVLTPKGTRSPRRYWKSGFYRMALGADLPVALGYVDAKTRTFGWGPSIRLSGDPKADMDVIRAFYADKVGVNPELASVARLRIEDEESGS